MPQELGARPLRVKASGWRVKASGRRVKASGRRGGFEGEGVKLAAHRPAQSFIDKLMLTHPGQAAECGRDDAHAIVIAVPGQILNIDLRVGEGPSQAGLYFLS